MDTEQSGITGVDAEEFGTETNDTTVVAGVANDPALENTGVEPVLSEQSVQDGSSLLALEQDMEAKYGPYTTWYNMREQWD